MKEQIYYIFDLYVAGLQQFAAATTFFGIIDNNYPFLIQNILNNEFLSIQNHFWWKKAICSILACMQQICSSMQQLWFFWVYWKVIILFYYKVFLKIIFSPFEAILNKKTNMLHFQPVCSKYAAVCSNRDLFPMSTPSRFF